MKKTVIALAALLLTGTAAMNAQALPSEESQEKTMTAYLVSNAHFDTQWNWDIQTSISEYVKKTLYQNLELMDQYPDYIFNFEGAVKYFWMKEYYPERWEELKSRIAEGRWHLTGSGWDACETIICSPESWIRNITLGQDFYRREFNTESTDVFLPDCFGFPYTLPTLAAHCGLIGFSSQKLGWRGVDFYGPGKKYPFTVGLWEGIDGSRIMMAHGFDYGKRWRDEDLSQSREIIGAAKQSPLNIAYRYYGTGDTGGSPTATSVRAVERGINEAKGPVRIISATSDQLYKDFLPFDQHPELPLFKGELTMDLHGNACYTSQAAMKLYNRQNEHLGDAAERASVIADWTGAKTYPLEELTADWRRVIVHQFHDDITGTSIPRVYEFSWNDELISLNRFSGVLTSAVNGISSQLDTRVSGTPLVIYNAEAFDVTSIATVDLDDATKGYKVTNADGKEVPSQVILDSNGKAHLIFEATVPATGCAVYGMQAKGSARKAVSQQDGKNITVENSIYKMVIENGEITSLTDKRENRELVADGRAIRPVMLDECNSRSWPAWEILKRTLDREPVAINENINVVLAEDGPVRKTVKVTRRYGDTEIAQFISLYNGTLADRIDIHFEADFQSYNVMLKQEFPFNVKTGRATYDLGLGCVERPTNCETGYEVYSHEWTDLSDADGAYGVTILNDSRYGWDHPDEQTLRLSLIYSPQEKGKYQSEQDFGWHTVNYSMIAHNGAVSPATAARQAAVFNSPLKVFAAPRHNGVLGKTFSFATCDNPNVLIRTLKHAEATDEYVVRVHELSGSAAQTAHITFPAAITAAVVADGTEKTLSPAQFDGKSLTVNVRPFSVATYKITLAATQTPAPASVQQPMTLAYNRRTATLPQFEGEADFEGGNSYAAELFPKDGKLEADGIQFTLADPTGRNALACNGDTLTLPEGNWNRLYLLASSNENDRVVTFTLGSGKKAVAQKCTVPFYSGFIGQWGHKGQTVGYMKDADIAYVGTHTHDGEGDNPHIFGYLFRLSLDIPKGATSVILPADQHVYLFAATVAQEEQPAVTAATALFNNGSRVNAWAPGEEQEATVHENLLSGATVVACSGYVNERERPEFCIDGNPKTKWCDTNDAPNYVVFDMGETKTVSGWSLLNAGCENKSDITRTALLMGRNNDKEEWALLDMIDGNRSDIVNRQFNATDVRYIRLVVIGPVQDTDGGATRIYEFGVY